MKIGIYGDSYADCNPNISTAWPNILSKKLMNYYSNNFEVINYAKAGSSLYFSYKNLLDTYTKHDLIIFLVTEPHRYPIPFKSIKSQQTFYITCFEHVKQIEHDLINLLEINEYEFLQNLKGWFLASNETYNNDISELILNQIERMSKNTILYPCFTDSFSVTRFAKYKLDRTLHPMHSFWYRQLELLGIEPNNFTAQEKSTLQGHLTPEFNEYFANVLYSKITTGDFDHRNFFDISIKYSKEYYYKNWD